jgi:hypothetical protein
MIRLFPLCILSLLSCTEQKTETQTPATPNATEKQTSTSIESNKSTVDSTTALNKKTDYSVKSIQTENGWGYQIFKGKKLLINQPTIPAVQGNKSFSSELDAIKVGELVVNKLLQNQFPPTVSSEELISLGVVTN